MSGRTAWASTIRRWVCGSPRFQRSRGCVPGGIAWIAGSGSAFSALCHNDRRLGFSLVVSSGGELVTTIADYIDWSLDQPSTRVIGLFLEQIRAPDRFVAALERAAEANIPVVALKVGRTARSAAMALTHTGALAGNHAAVAALFQRHGVIEVDDLDEMVATLQLFDMPRRFAKGGLATVHDSGGERELLVDLAAAEGVRFGEISDATKAAIAPNLEAGLVAENPLDAWGTDKDYSSRYARSLAALLADDDVAACGFFSEVRVDYWYSKGIIEAVRSANAGSAKPCFIASNTWTTRDEPIATALAAESIPVLKGSRNALRAVGNVVSRRDFKRWPQPISALGLAKGIRARLASGARIGEAEALMMLATLGMTVPKLHLAMSLDGAIGAAADIGFPVALKTAEDHAHKSDVGGVRINLADRAAVAAAYVEMAARLGPRVMVAAMAPAGVEIGLGGIVDPDFGPVVLLSAGGILIELFDDKISALAPFGDDEAHELLRRLKVHRLLLGVRGRPAADIGATAHAIALFSQILAGVASEITEIDVNPLIAAPARRIRGRLPDRHQTSRNSLMDLSLTRRERDLAARARRLVDEVLQPLELIVEEHGEVPMERRPAIIEAVRAAGLAGINHAREHGGQGFTMVEQTLMELELGRLTNGLWTCVWRPAVPLKFGTQAQIDKFLMPCCEGRRRPCVAITEPDAGSDAGAVKATAVKDGNRWLISGEKWFVTSFNASDIIIVQANVDGDPAKSSLFLVEKPAERMRHVRSPRFMHTYAFDHAELIFDRTPVPLDNLLGEVGQGFELTKDWFVEARLQIASHTTGAAIRALEVANDYAAGRVQFGQPIRDFQAVEFMLADMAVDIFAAKTMLMRVAAEIDAGLDRKLIHARASALKLFCSEMAGRVVDKALQILGGRGYMRENPVERLYRDLRVDRIWEGTSEIQRVIIAGQIKKRGPGVYTGW